MRINKNMTYAKLYTKPNLLQIDQWRSKIVLKNIG